TAIALANKPLRPKNLLLEIAADKHQDGYDRKCNQSKLPIQHQHYHRYPGNCRKSPDNIHEAPGDGLPDSLDVGCNPRQEPAPGRPVEIVEFQVLEMVKTTVPQIVHKPHFQKSGKHDERKYIYPLPENHPEKAQDKGSKAFRVPRDDKMVY